jgi:hypothetical protein
MDRVPATEDDMVFPESGVTAAGAAVASNGGCGGLVIGL